MDRVRYVVQDININGVKLTNADITNVNTSFVLDMCFCSCPFPLDSMISEFNRFWAPTLSQDIELHYTCCPNAKKERFLRDVTEEELNKIRNARLVI